MTPRKRTLRPSADFVFLSIALILPLADGLLPKEFRFADLMRPIFIFAVMGLGLNIVTGFTGLLHLGSAAFMAIGAYAYAILTCEIYPFRMGFWLALPLTAMIGAGAGVLLGSPTLRLRGDYVAIVTLGFGEIVQDTLRNLEVITKGNQGINPLPYPEFFGGRITPERTAPWYYLLLAVLALAVLLNRRMERSRLGRAWIAIREDELAASCMGVNATGAKLLSFAAGSAFCAAAGALWAGLLGSSGEPGNYDFSISIIALCMVIVGGMGSVGGVLLGALVMIGIDSIVLTKLTGFLTSRGLSGGNNVLSQPGNWKYMIFGLALILMMRFKPEGLLPSRRVKGELRPGAGGESA